jgi:hypothetical protein
MLKACELKAESPKLKAFYSFFSLCFLLYAFSFLSLELLAFCFALSAFCSKT